MIKSTNFKVDLEGDDNADLISMAKENMRPKKSQAEWILTKHVREWREKKNKE